MIDLTQNAVLERILRELDADTSVGGKRGAVLAFLRCVELAGQDAQTMSEWRADSSHFPGTAADCNGFAAMVYREIWPLIPLDVREEMAAQALHIAAAYDAEKARSAR